MSADPLPVLRCESRRPPAFERGFLLWSLAVVLFGATALDAFWAAPERSRRAHERERATLEVELPRCREVRRAPARRVEDIKLLTPTQAAR